MPYPPQQLGSLAHIYAGAPTRHARVAGNRRARLLASAQRVLSVRALLGARILADALISAEPLTSDTSHCVARAGDVIVPARSTSFSAAILPEELDGVVINATLIGIRCGDRLHPRLLAAYLRHPVGLAAINELSQSGTAQMNVTVRGLAELPVPVPPRQAQDRIARMLEAADAARHAAICAAERRYYIAAEIVLQTMTHAPN